MSNVFASGMNVNVSIHSPAENNASPIQITVLPPKDGAPGYTPEKGKDYFTPSDKEEIVKEVINSLPGTGGSLPSGDKPNQMLVTDTDGNTVWQDRTHYVSRGITEIMPAAQYAFADGMSPIMNPLPDAINEGASLIAVYNSEEYPVTVVAFDFEGMPTIGFGNIGAFTGGDITNEPFVFVKIPDEIAAQEGIYAVLLDVTGASTALFAIKGEGEIVHKIDEKYLPSSFVPRVITINAEDESNVRIDCSFPEAWEMSERELASSIMLKTKDGDECAASFVTKFDASEITGVQHIQASFGIFDDTVGDQGHTIKIVVWTYAPSVGMQSIKLGKSIRLFDYYALPGRLSGEGLKVNTLNDTIGVECGVGLDIYKNALALVLKSTTPGSTKRFTITVDDSGTLTASELTY